MKDALRILIEQIPRHSEEGNLCLSVPSGDLKAALCRQSGHEPEVISTLVDILECLFLSLRVLDEEAASAGLWKFVSFAAQLVALSILETLSDKTQYLLPKYFWVNDPSQQEGNAGFCGPWKRTGHSIISQQTPGRFASFMWPGA